MKANLLLLTLLLCSVVTSNVYSQTTIGRMKVDQYPYTSYGTMTYGLTWVPPTYDPSKKYPLIIFMHGAGEGGDGVSGLNTLLAQGLPWWIAKGFSPQAVNPADGKTYEFIVVCPQAPAAWKWSYSYAQIQYILPDVLKRYSIDESRIYITGLSAGGAGTWSCVTNDPNFAKKIAAIMPNSDAGLNNTPVEGPSLKLITGTYGVPVWCVDGGNDGLNAHTTVYIDTINNGPPKANPQAVQTIIPGACHCANAWDSAYSPTWRSNVFNMNAYEWMLQYQRAPASLSVSAGGNQTITLPASSASLAGSATPSAGNSISSYAWTQTGGPVTAVIASASGLSTGVSGLTVAGTYTFQLTAKDNTGATASGTVTVTVKAANVPPTAGAGSAQTIQLPVSSVTLTGTASGNGGATISSTTWTQTSGPVTGTIASSSSLSTGVSGLTTAGTYVFTLTAKDNNGLTGSASVTITVKAANVPPTAGAGSAQTIQLPVSSVTLAGTATGNGGATISSTAWTQTSGPVTATIASSSSLSTGVSGLTTAGTYVFTITAKDNNGLTGSASVTITVKAANVPPTVGAGSAQTIQLPASSVTLTGTAAGNGGATISSTTWTQTGGPVTAVIASASGLSTGVSGLTTAGTYVFTLTAKDNNGLTGTSSVTIIVNTAAYVAPTADAGSAQTIQLPVSAVTLTGTATGNGGATIVSTGWTQTSGPVTATIASSSSLSTGVSGLTAAGTYVFQLVANDNHSLSDAASVTITVKAANVAPTAGAGSAQTIQLPVSAVTLTGTASGNGGATIVSTDWTQTSGPVTATIAAASSLSTGVSGLTTAGTYVFTITVKDNNGLTGTGSVTITVKAANVAPTAGAGSAQTIQLPVSSVTLTGTAAGNGGATIVSTDWTQTSGPVTAVIASASGLSTGVSGLTVAGAYVFTITIKDNNGLSATAQVTVTVLAAAVPPPPPPPPPPPSNQGPVADAGVNRTVQAPVDSIRLDGSASYDPDGTIASYTWIQTTGLGGVTITSANTPKPAVYGLVKGQYQFELTVTDNAGATDKASVTILVNEAVTPPPAKAPIANAGRDTSISLPSSTALLNGLASTDPNGGTLAYAWTQVSGPSAASIANAASGSTSVGKLAGGLYVFQLTVTNAAGLWDTASVRVRVIDQGRNGSGGSGGGSGGNSGSGSGGSSVRVQAYPNPVLDVVHIRFVDDSTAGTIKMNLYDVRGRIVQTREVVISGPGQEVTLNLSGLFRGIYILKMTAGNKTGTQLLVKQ